MRSGECYKLPPPPAIERKTPSRACPSTPFCHFERSTAEREILMIHGITRRKLSRTVYPALDAGLEMTVIEQPLYLQLIRKPKKIV
jgi:hypothetical protein